MPEILLQYFFFYKKIIWAQIFNVEFSVVGNLLLLAVVSLYGLLSPLHQKKMILIRTSFIPWMGG